MEQCDATPLGIRNRAFLLLLEGTGARISEALAFDPRDFDWDQERVNIRRAKGNKQRVVPVAPEALVDTRAWLDARTKHGISARAHICCSLRGKGISPSHGRRLVSQIAKRAGIRKRVHPHGFRHRYTIRLVRYGVPITSVQHALGHENLATTHEYCQRIGVGPAIDDVRAMLDQE